MDGTVPKIFYNFYLNFMNFLIFLNSRGPGSKFQISSGGARPLVRGGPAPWAKGVSRGGAMGAAAPPLGNLTPRKAIKIMIFI